MRLTDIPNCPKCNCQLDATMFSITNDGKEYCMISEEFYTYECVNNECEWGGFSAEEDKLQSEDSE